MSADGISEKVNWQGGGNFIFADLMKWNMTFKEQLTQAYSQEELLAIFQEMKEKAFLDYRIKLDEFAKNIDTFMSFPLAKQQEILYDLLDKNQLYVNVTEMDDETFRISEEDKRFNRSFYSSQIKGQ
ncbi:hypothetical protein J9303_06855 [Bacillaceae bacterium Marseille-Q3522]|nr:hypothetical protein [Bacillaceae bacterium Marseille-Q3522]